MSMADLAAARGLHRVGARPPLLAYLRETWARREFATTMARFRIRSSNEQNRLGMVWVVLQPALNALIYGTIFGLLQGERRGENFAQYVVIGVFLFQFFTACMNSGAKSITGNRTLVQSLAFPRLTLPVSVVLEQLFALLPTLAVMFGILLLTGIPPSPRWLLMLPLLALYVLFSSGVAMIAARLTVHVRDLTQLLPFISRVLFYSSGVLFNPERILGDYPRLLALFDFHPLHEVLGLARHLLLPPPADGTVYAEPVYWLYFSVWTLVLLVAGLLFFWVAEERYGRVD